MSQIVRAYGPTTANPVASGSTVIAEHINTDLDTIYADHNGGLTNYNIASAANIAISKTALGTYTAWATWTPSYYKADNSTALAAVTTIWARYTQIGKLVTITIDASGFGDPSGNFVYFTLPVTANTGTSAPSGFCFLASGAGPTRAIGVLSVASAGARIAVQFWPASAWGGVNNEFGLTWSYEAA